jgi:hypothetical protein
MLIKAVDGNHVGCHHLVQAVAAAVARAVLFHLTGIVD